MGQYEEPAKGTPPRDYTPENVRALGWCAEARGEDGKCASFTAWVSAQSLAEFINDYEPEFKVTIFPENLPH